MPEEFDFVSTDAAAIYNTVLNSLMESVNEPLYPGDERRIFAEGVVAVMVALYNEFNDKMKQRTLRYARGVVLDAIGERYDVHRLEPAHAAATFRFTVAGPMEENIIIPAGTRITTDGTVYFATDSVAVLQAGQVTADVVGTCQEGGAAYNGFMAGQIATLVDLIPIYNRSRTLRFHPAGTMGSHTPKRGTRNSGSGSCWPPPPFRRPGRKAPTGFTPCRRTRTLSTSRSTARKPISSTSIR